MWKQPENLKRLAGTLGILGSLIGIGALVLIAVSTFAPLALNFNFAFPNEASSMPKQGTPNQSTDSYEGNCVARPTSPGATPRGFGTFQVDCRDGNTTDVTIDQRTTTSSK